MTARTAILILTAAAATAAPSAVPAEAQTLWAGRDALPSTATVQSIAPQDLLILLDSMDIEAELTELPQRDGARAHRLAITANTDGLYWDVVFYNCAGETAATPPAAAGEAEGEPPALPQIDLRAGTGCRDFAISAGFDLEFPVSVQTINRFNREHRFARAVLSDEGAPVIEMDVNLEGGVSRDALEVEIEAWRALLLSFSKFVGY